MNVWDFILALSTVLLRSLTCPFCLFLAPDLVWHFFLCQHPKPHALHLLIDLCNMCKNKQATLTLWVNKSVPEKSCIKFSALFAHVKYSAPHWNVTLGCREAGENKLLIIFLTWKVLQRDTYQLIISSISFSLRIECIMSTVSEGFMDKKLTIICLFWAKKS